MPCITEATDADFTDLAPFVAAAIRDAFYRPDLTRAQVAENARIVAIAETVAKDALDHPDRTAFVAKVPDEKGGAGRLAGFVIVKRDDKAMPEIDWLIVAPEFQGQGVASALMQHALAWIGDGVPVQLGVIHFNERAIAFYKKHGFADTGQIVGRHAIQRRLMVRPA